MAYNADVGFYDRDAVRHLEIFKQLCKHGELIETGGMSYLKWSVGHKVELWTRVKDGQPEMLYYPCFAGEARMKVALLEKMSRRKTELSEGAFFCRGGASAGEGWVAGRNPFIFDTIHYHRYERLSLPRLSTVQLTGFAFRLTGFENEEEYDEAYPADDEGYCWDYKHFIPSLMFDPRDEGGELQSASAEVSGWVLETNIITNPATGLDFCWAKLDTIGGEVDVVCAPERLSGYLLAGGIAVARCYLYGRLTDDECH
ncbi:MAG: hypothetical protein ABW208_22480 [Pyrinomonadaceae bacterium]